VVSITSWTNMFTKLKVYWRTYSHPTTKDPLADL